MATDLKECIGKNGSKLLWNRELEPRKKSGIVGEITINLQFTVEEISQILTKIKSDAHDKADAERDVLKSFGIERENAKADTTDEVSMAVLAAFKAGVSAQRIAAKMREQAFSEQQIQKYLPELSKIKFAFSFI